VVVVIGLLLWLLLLLLLWTGRYSKLADVDKTLLPVLVISATDYHLYLFDEWSYRNGRHKCNNKMMATNGVSINRHHQVVALNFLRNTVVLGA
jgi:hypothetical protein